MQTIEDRQPIELLPQPLDPLILGGIALTPYYDEAEIGQVIKRLATSFDELKKDTTKEFGACLAYGIDLPIDEEAVLDFGIIHRAEKLNHGRVTSKKVVMSDDHSELCRGFVSGSNKEFVIAKRLGAIVFDNGSIQNGVIYSLNGRARLK